MYSSHSILYQRVGLDTSCIENAIQTLTNANPEDDKREAAMWMLSLSYKHLFRVDGDITHLSASIEITEEHIATTSNSNVQAMHFTTLAELKRKRFDKTQEPADINGAIDAIHMAIALTPHNDYDKQAERLTFLGTCLGKGRGIG